MATVDELLALIPGGGDFTTLRNTISLIGSVFPDALNEITADRLQGWITEIQSGDGRDDDAIREDIFDIIVTAPVIQARLGVSPEEAEALISGEQTFADTDIPSTAPGVEAVGDTVIPEGMRLVRVRNPDGTDASELYYLVGTWNGVEFSYEIGDLDRLEEQFGSTDAFDNVETFNSQAAFDQQEFVDAGSADQIYGAGESLQALFDREVADLGMEDLPAWLAGDEEALAMVAQATAQGWSSGRLWTELSDTQGFTDRFGGIIDQYTEGGTTIGAAVEQIIADEQQLRSAIRQFRPEGFEVTNEYLHQVMGNGWTAQEASQVMAVAEDMRSNPDGLARANEILAASGLGTLNEVEFMNVMAGSGDVEVREALNTAQAARALEQAGLEDLDVDLLMHVVDTSDRLLTVESYQSLAQQLSFNLMRHSRELGASKLDISEEDVVAAAFGRESPTGKSSGEVLNLLARFERDRQAAAQGGSSLQAFIDEQGRLRTQGLSGL